jgi:hypothetical protein
MVSQYIDIYAGQTKSWGNLFHNANSVNANIYEYHNGGLADAGTVYGGLLYAGVTFDNLYASIRITGNIPYDNWPANMGLADTYYFTNGYSASTNWWYGQGVNGRK